MKKKMTVISKWITFLAPNILPIQEAYSEPIQTSKIFCEKSRLTIFAKTKS